ncbi:MAG: TolC family protein [Verrucomicrobia bacterium]|nr:TolC family protein [Verrucomicrobiota bacterium]
MTTERIHGVAARHCGSHALWGWVLRAWVLAMGAWLAGCSTGHYRKAADTEVYEIIQQAEEEVFGQHSAFTIETLYSSRRVTEIGAAEIVRQRQEPGALRLSLEEALALAVKNSREYQTEKERLYLTALSLTGARYAFTPKFLAGGSASVDRNTEGDVSAGAKPKISLSQLLQTGASLGASIAGDFLRFYTGDPARSAISTISVNLAQPLLRGAGKSIVAENLKQAERNVIYAIRTYSHYQRQFLVHIVTGYFELLQGKDQLVNAYNDYQRRLETIQYTEARGRAGRQKGVEVDEARSEELTAKNSYILAATAYRNNLDRFKLTLGLPLSTRIELDDAPLAELKASGLLPLSVDSQRALAIAVEHHLELLNQIDRFEDDKRQVRIAANRLKADLNIFADASLQSEPPTDYTTFDIEKVRAGAGIELDLPIDRLRERNEYRSTLVSFEAAIRALGLALDNKKDQIERGLRNLDASRRSYVIQTNAVAIAERRVEGEQLSLQAGLRTVRNVRDAQDILVRSQNALTEATVSHLAVRLQLLLDIGVLNTDLAHFWKRADAVTLSLEPASAGGGPSSGPDEVLPPDRILQL